MTERRNRLMEEVFGSSEEDDEIEEINATLKGMQKSIQDHQSAVLPLLESISTSLAKMSEYLGRIDDKLGLIDEKLENKQ